MIKKGFRRMYLDYCVGGEFIKIESEGEKTKRVILNFL